MATNKRLKLEYESIMEAKLDFLAQLEQSEENILKWSALLMPSNPPYDKSAFRIEIDFPSVYPFKPPIIKLKTPIYHPNVDGNGIPCLPIIAPDNWKPSLRMEEVLTALVALINCPELEHPLRPDLAQLLTKNPKKFHKKAEEYCKAHAEPRPRV